MTINAMRACARVLVVAASLCAVSPAAVTAQPGGIEREARLTELFSDMSVDTGLRVTTPMLFIEHGAFRGVGPGAVRIEYGGEVVPVELVDIRTVEVERHHPVKGMLWGLGAGLLVGSVSGMLVGSFYCDDPVDCVSEERKGAIIGGSSLGFAGGLGGFLIGKYQISWSRIFP